jgi:glycolate oxidase FAD binding subunit
MTTIRVATVEEVQAAVRAHARLRPVAGGTKPALSAARGDEQRLDLAPLTGVLDYQFAECTFTANAGTRIADVEGMLAQDGLYLPFDPPFSQRGATLGGTVASGVSGPGRLRYGGVRDFLLGVRFVDGEGRLVRGGARVVKNAAGFSLQHAFLGSLGRLGVLVEATFKVFPQPSARLTIAAELGTLDRALDALVRLRRSSFELEAADLVPPGTLLLRLGGVASALEARRSELIAFLSAPQVASMTGDEERRLWHDVRECTWAGSAAIVKVPVTPSRIAALDARLLPHDVPRRYSVAGDLAWLAWPGPIDVLDGILRELGLRGVMLTGDRVQGPLLGAPPDAMFLGRVRLALDPRGVFA